MIVGLVFNSLRLMIWIFLVDSSHAIFHRTPPKLALSEMTGGLPCDGEHFEALNLAQQAQFRCQRKIPSTKEGICILMGDEWTASSPYIFGRLNHLDLFVLISGTPKVLYST